MLCVFSTQQLPLALKDRGVDRPGTHILPCPFPHLRESLRGFLYGVFLVYFEVCVHIKVSEDFNKLLLLKQGCSPLQMVCPIYPSHLSLPIYPYIFGLRFREVLVYGYTKKHCLLIYFNYFDHYLILAGMFTNCKPQVLLDMVHPEECSPPSYFLDLIIIVA